MICPKCGSNNVIVQATSETTGQAMCRNCGYGWNVSRVQQSPMQVNQTQQNYSYRQNSNERQTQQNYNLQQNNQYQPQQNYNYQHPVHNNPKTPFYCTTWFLVVMGIFLPPVGIALLWIFHKDMEQKKKIIYTAVMAIWFIFALAFGGGGSSDDSTNTVSETPQVNDAISSEAAVNEPIISNEPAEPTEPTSAAPTMTIGEENALKKALSYLRMSAFSRKGLIEQLEYEGFTHEEAVFAVDNCGADWNEQAAKKARAYLNYSSFSKKELIEQLEFEGFTHEQAEYGAAAVGY